MGTADRDRRGAGQMAGAFGARVKAAARHRGCCDVFWQACRNLVFTEAFV